MREPGIMPRHARIVRSSHAVSMDSGIALGPDDCGELMAPPAHPRDQSELERGRDARHRRRASRRCASPTGRRSCARRLAEGPFGVETQEHVESVALPLRRLVESDNASDAFVIACYSDPGLHVCREGTARPVFGIAECGVLTALARAERFGVIAILQRSIARHMRYLRQMGLMDRLAGERPLELSVAESASEKTLAAHDRGRPRAEGAGRRQRDRDGLRRHGAPSQAAGRRARHSGDRSDPGRGDDGDRRGAAALQPSFDAARMPRCPLRCAGDVLCSAAHSS